MEALVSSFGECGVNDRPDTMSVSADVMRVERLNFLSCMFHLSLCI